MPIHLTTGLPGAGKTLKTIVDVKEMAERENRQVYYHGINDLTLSWKLLDDPKQWNTLPEGSIIVIDECQDLYPVHEAKLSAEPHVLQLAKHRHRGYDIFLISQHPMNIHAFIRRLIDKHQHLIRAFGSKVATVHSWNRVIDYPEKTKKDSQSAIFSYPADAFKYYKSAELHTIQRKLPKRLYWLLLIPPLLIGLGYLTWTKLNPEKTKANIMQAGGAAPLSTDFLTAPPVAVAPPVVALTYLAAHVPEVADFPHTAPAFVDIVKPVAAPYPAACVQMGNLCKCYTQQGTKLQTSEPVCRQIVENGFFVEWDQKPQVDQVPVVSKVDPARDVDGSFTNAQGMGSRSSPINAPTS